jgi:hypothetical protein
MMVQVAGDANLAGQVYPDQSLYPSNSVPALVERINNALQRADQIERAEGHVQVRMCIVCFGLQAWESVFFHVERPMAVQHVEDKIGLLHSIGLDQCARPLLFWSAAEAMGLSC